MHSTPTDIPWLVVPTPNPTARLRLICLPYAGGGASVYAGWPRALPADLEVAIVQLPGREARLDEPAMTQWTEVVDGIAAAVRPWIDRPCALFGHSLGALLAFEVLRQLRREGALWIARLFVSGCRAPHLPIDEPLLHTLPQDDFIAALQDLKGTPAELFDCPELLDTYLPALRADFRLWESYVFHEEAPLATPMSAYGGLEDDLATPAKVEAWRLHTSSTFRQVMFPGGHFFVREQRDAVVSALGDELRRGGVYGAGSHGYRTHGRGDRVGGPEDR